MFWQGWPFPRVRRPGDREFYPHGRRRRGYLLPAHATGVADAFEGRWRRRFIAYLIFFLVLVVAFGPWGMAAGSAGGAAVVLLYSKAARATFSGFDVLAPDLSRTGAVKDMEDRANASGYGKIAALYVGGLLFLGASFYLLREGDVEAPRHTLAAAIGLFFSACAFLEATLSLYEKTTIKRFRR